MVFLLVKRSQQTGYLTKRHSFVNNFYHMIKMTENISRSFLIIIHLVILSVTFVSSEISGKATICEASQDHLCNFGELAKFCNVSN